MRSDSERQDGQSDDKKTKKQTTNNTNSLLLTLVGVKDAASSIFTALILAAIFTRSSLRCLTHPNLRAPNKTALFTSVKINPRASSVSLNLSSESASNTSAARKTIKIWYCATYPKMLVDCRR